jgi:hypothetical protein
MPYTNYNKIFNNTISELENSEIDEAMSESQSIQDRNKVPTFKDKSCYNVLPGKAMKCLREQSWKDKNGNTEGTLKTAPGPIQQS